MTELRYQRAGVIEYLAAPALAACGFLVHAFLTRRGGFSRGNYGSLNFSCREGDRPEAVASNWQLLARSFNLDPAQFVVMQQVHGDRIVVIADADRPLVPAPAAIPPEAYACDALVTDRPGIAIGVKTADCVPLFLVDRVRHVIAAVHAGWRGTALDIAGQTVDTFLALFSSRPEDILAAVGPAIGACCYEVDAVVHQALYSYEAGGESFFRPRAEKDRWMLDLAMVNRRQLEQRGIPPENIFSANQCTSCRRDSFYSHRRDRGLTGRHFNFLMLKTSSV